jgi:O-antigen biosynthesis protein
MLGVSVPLQPEDRAPEPGDDDVPRGSAILLPAGVVLPAGYYRLSWKASPGGPEHGWRLKVVTALGEVRIIWLASAQRRGARIRCDVLLSDGGSQPVLVPPPGAVGPPAGAVRLRRLSRSEYYAAVALRRAVGLARQGRSPARILRRALALLRQGGPRLLAARIREGAQSWERSAGSYRQWLAAERAAQPIRDAEVARALARIGEPPTIAVVMPVYEAGEAVLRAAVESVVAQSYPHWELCIADDCSRSPHVVEVLREYAGRDERIRFVIRATNGGISAATNTAFGLVRSEWVAMLDHDDVLAPGALAEVALVAADPDARLIYSDEDKIGANGDRFEPFFKPDFSRELFRSQNYLNHLTVYRAANVRDAGGWDSRFDGSQDYDLALRVIERIEPASIRHIPRILYHWRVAAGSTALEAGEKNFAHRAGLEALRAHVARTGLAADVETSPGVPYYRLRLRLPASPPLVSIVIPTRDRVDLLRACIDSVIRLTRYANYEIVVVDNGSSEDATLGYLASLCETGRARVIRHDAPFNFSALNNLGVDCALGEIVALVNNDIEVISPDWLGEMVSWAIQPDVGCVGAKLYYGDDTIQHAGVILGIGGVAGHSHKYLPREANGYFSRLRLVQNVSAVTGACLVVRKSVYKEVGGLDAKNLAVAFNDVDFCLKVRQAGYANVWTPHAELFHHESPSRGAEDTREKQERFMREVLFMKGKWAGLLDTDPFYSTHLSREREDFSLRLPSVSERRPD